MLARHGRSAATAGGSRRGLGGLGSSDGFSPDYQPYPANSYAATFRSGPLPPTTSGAIRRSPAGYLPVTASGSSFHGDGGYYPTLTGSSLSLRYLTGSPLSSRHHLTESPLSLQHHLSESPLSRNTTIHSLDISQRRPRRTISQLPDFPGFQQDLRGASATVGGGGNGGGKRVVFVERVSSDSPLRVQTQQAGYDHDSGFASCASFASPVGNFNSPGDARHSANGRRGGGGGRGDGGAGGGCGENGMSRRSLTQPKNRVSASHSIGPCTSFVTGGSCRAVGYHYPRGATPGLSHSGRCHLGGSFCEHHRSEDYQIRSLRGDCYDGGSIGRDHSGQRHHISGGRNGGKGGTGHGGGSGVSEGGGGMGSRRGVSEDDSGGDELRRSGSAGPATPAAVAAVAGTGDT
ncbi:unnamed protein product [Closterium sp. NIES-53]